MATNADTKVKKYYCSKCGQTMRGTEFYKVKKGSDHWDKYEARDGFLNECKKCITMHVDNWDPETFIPILQEADVPYIEEIWNELLTKYSQGKTKITGMTILGRYLSIMQLTQHKDEYWKDTERLKQEKIDEKKSTMRAEGYSEEQIEQELKKEKPIVAKPPKPQLIALEDSEAEEAPAADSVSLVDEEEQKIIDSLTEENKTYLRLKWGKEYRYSELVQLEQLYEDMMASYDVQSAGHIDNLKLVCKASLKSHQLISIGDVDGFQKMSRAYDQLMKMGNFTAAQNKGESGDCIDSLGELIAMCEKDGFIPRYYTDGPQDKVDRTLEDLQHYTRTLVMEEMNLGNLIEQSANKIAEQMKKESSATIDDADNLDDEDAALEKSIFEDQEIELTLKDYEDFNDFEDELAYEDEKYINELIGED